MQKLTATFTALFLLTLSGCAHDPLLDVVTPKDNEVSPATVSRAGLYEITTFDVYADKNGRTHLLVGGKAAKMDKKVSLRYLSSDDGGLTWSKPLSLGNKVTPTIATRGNDVQIAANGKNILALWQSKGELPGMGPLNTAFSNDGGKTWQKAGNPALNNAGDQSHADVLADRQGNFHAVWLEDPEENGYQSLRYARLNTVNLQWSKPQTLDDSTCSCCWNTLNLSADNTINLLYRDMKPRDMALLTANDNGASWHNRGHVGEFDWQFDGCPHVGGGLISISNQPKHLHAMVWTGEASKAGLYFLHSSDAGKRWTIPQKMGNNAIHADIAANDVNHIAAVWDELQPEGTDIFFTSSDDGGIHWRTPELISVNTVSATHPRLLSMPQGYLALWTEKTSKHPMQLAWQILTTR